MHAAVLRYFAAVARSGSIRKASEELHVAGSALSRQIRKLEGELGTALFERHPGGQRLTRAGDIALRHARATLQDFERLKSELGALRGENIGQIDIASLDSLLVQFLPTEIARFHAAHPNVDFRVRSAMHGTVTTLVAEGEADIGITFNLPHPEDTRFIADVPMPLMAMVAGDHPLAGRESVSIAECSRYNLLLQLDTVPMQSVIEVELSVLERTGRALVRSNNLLMLRPIVEAGLGVAFFTPIGLSEELRSGAIVGVPLTGSRLGGLRLGLLVPKRRRPTHAVTTMIEQLEGALAELARRVAPAGAG